MFSPEDESLLKNEIVGLFGQMNRMRRELAALNAGNGDMGDFASVEDTLNAIVENTETASNTILESMEVIDEAVARLKVETCPAVRDACEQMAPRINRVFEACSFQDLTGQRIARVVSTLKFVEERVNQMVRMWGREELEKTVAELKRDVPETEEVAMHGPQRAGAGITQEEVDQLFSQDDIDKLFG